MMTKLRNEIALQDKWNVENLYANKETWEKAFNQFVDLKTTPYWPQLQKFKGTLSKGPKEVLAALKSVIEIERQLSSIYTYAHLRHDEDITNPDYKKMYDQIVTCAHALSEETSWMLPELLNLPNQTLQEYIKSPDLKEYSFYLEKMVRIKNHTLSPENEKIIALSGQSMETASKAFRAMSDADFQFGEVTDKNSQLKPLTHGTYGIYIRDHDRVLRKNAFFHYHDKYKKYENTLAELLNGQIQSHLFNVKARNYSNCLEAALYPKNIDTSVYYSLIKAVNDKLDILHRYMSLRKQILNVDQLHLYDVYVPLIEAVDFKIPYNEAEDLIIESVAPLGEEYQSILKKGLKDQRWVDRYENKNKRSGAYSSGCYDSYPYILMNYKSILRDVFTLAHEAGHSMHSYYSHKHQPYQYGDYPIFLAEVASTFNENLLTRLMLKKCQNIPEKIYLINQQIEDIRGTLFRQTMFAEFELNIHEKVEQMISLTPELLNEEFTKLNKKYFGPAVTIDPEIGIEWARIPHFYYNFYVFQYSTGISAATALAERVTSGGAKEREDYLNFLKAGSSRYPIDILKLAGIDMTTPEPVIAAINKFDQLLNELENLLVGANFSN